MTPAADPGARVRELDRPPVPAPPSSSPWCCDCFREDGADVALPIAGGYRQPLAAGYRVSLAATAERLVAADRLRPAHLFDQCAVTTLDEARLRQDPALAAVDPELDSVLNVNEPADYQAARARPAPEVTVRATPAGR